MATLRLARRIGEIDYDAVQHLQKKLRSGFITKIINGKQKQEGLCLSCAKKQGIQPINQLIEQTGMTDRDIETLNKQMGNLFENLDIDSIAEGIDAQDGEEGNPFFNFITRAFPRNDVSKDRQKGKDGELTTWIKETA